MKDSSEAEMNFNSIERVFKYCQREQEGEVEQIGIHSKGFTLVYAYKGFTLVYAMHFRIELSHTTLT